jgi:hypothetical protein
MEKIHLVERRKLVERDPLVVGIAPYKLFNRDVVVP